MKRSLILSETLDELIRPLPPLLKQKIRKSVEEILENPASGKSLIEDLQGSRSYKVGKLRIIYREQGSSIELVDIGKRKTIYLKVALEIKKRKGIHHV